MGRRDTAKRMKRHRIKLLRLVILFILLVTMIVSGIKIIKWAIYNSKTKENLKKVEQYISVDEKTGEYKVDFSELKNMNSDILCWVKVGGLNISYPVVKGSDNSYYLNHSIDKSYNTAGWIFMDYKNKFDGTDRNIIIYGHNRRDGSMFCKLKDVLKEEWYSNKDNCYVDIYTEEGITKYEVFSVYTVKDEDYYITTSFTTNSYRNFINNMKSRSVYNFGVDVTTDDQILTLSTCADNNDYRVVLHAKKVVNIENVDI